MRAEIQTATKAATLSHYEGLCSQLEAQRRELIDLAYRNAEGFTALGLTGNAGNQIDAAEQLGMGRPLPHYESIVRLGANWLRKGDA